MCFLKKAIIFSLLVFLTSNCAGHNQNAGHNHNNAPTPAQSASQRELPIPVVPPSLTDPVERADFVTARFWDKADFSDHSVVNDTAFMEQSFSNFISILPYGTIEGAKTAIGALIAKTDANDFAFRRIKDLTDHYLRDPNSPMRDDRLYILFANALLSSGRLSEAEKVRTEYFVEMALLNPVGSVANDLAFIDKSGKLTSIKNIDDGKAKILFFYDPECNTCNEYIRLLQGDPRVSELIADAQLDVVALCAEGDREVWQKKRDAMPITWIHGFIPEEEIDADRYNLDALPSLYLLAPDFTVILKDTDPQVLLGHLRQ